MDIMKFFNLVKFILALIQGNYVTVTEFSRFFNFLCGTHTNTVGRINKMLCKAGYQGIYEDVIYSDDEQIYLQFESDNMMYYIPTVKGLKWNKLATIEREKYANNTIQVKEIKYLQWDPQILFRIFDFKYDDDVNEISNKIVKKAKEYNLINTYREIIDRDILRKNLSMVKKIFDLVENKKSNELK